MRIDDCAAARKAFATVAAVRVQNLMSELSIWRCSDELRAYCGEIWAKEKKTKREAIEEERKRRNYSGYWAPVPPTEPFRCVLAQVWLTPLQSTLCGCVPLARHAWCCFTDPPRRTAEGQQPRQSRAWTHRA